MGKQQIDTPYVNWFDTSVAIGTRKRHFINYRLNEGWSFWYVINYANKMFGKKPDYHEPAGYQQKCQHEFVIKGFGQDVVCNRCGHTCPDCGGFPGLYNVCDTCGTCEGISV